MQFRVNKDKVLFFIVFLVCVAGCSADRRGLHIRAATVSGPELRIQRLPGAHPLYIRLTLKNNGPETLIVDSELIWMVAVSVLDNNERHVNTHRSNIDKEAACGVTQLAPGGVITRDIDLVKGFEEFRCATLQYGSAPSYEGVSGWFVRRQIPKELIPDVRLIYVSYGANFCARAAIRQLCSHNQSVLDLYEGPLTAEMAVP